MTRPKFGKLARTAVKLLIVAIIVGFAIYKMKFSPVQVQANAVARGAIVSEVLGTGTLEARTRASISPRISGRVASVLADQNDRVTKGQLLATLDDADLKQQVEVASAELSAVQASVDRAAADIARAQANATQARASYARYAQLATSKIISDEDFSKATQQRDVADAELNRSQLAKIEMERAVAKAQASLRYYQERLVDTQIAAPFDGLIVRRTRDPGDVVVPGGTILEIISTEQLWVSAWVDETAMGALAVDQPARIVFRSSPERSFAGKVARLAPQTDRETREFLVDVSVEELPRTWAIGQRTEVYIETGRRAGVLSIAQQALTWRGGEAWVMVDDSGAAAWRKIELGMRGSDRVEVTNGLTEGDVVITAPAGATLPSEGRSITRGKP